MGEPIETRMEIDLTGREFVFTESDFERIRKLLYDHAGIVLSDYKKDMAYNRLVRRIRELSLSGFPAYFNYLDGDEDEFGQFINALTTNLTAFFREMHHFNYLEQIMLPALQAQGQQRLRIWSAGCSQGEEPYSIAMSCLASGVDTRAWDIKILATDIDSKVLATGQGGVYGMERIDNVTERYRKRFLRRGKGAQQGKVKIADEVKNLVTFKQLNLMQPWPMKGPFDAIFCRNVMIYFDSQTQSLLLGRMAEMLKPQGVLFVGHSESPCRVSDRFRLIGQTIYERVY